MSDIQLYLIEADKNKAEARAVAAQSAEKLESKQLKLIDLITSLEEYINNKDDGKIRAKSVAFLADVLEAVPHKVLSLQERRLLCDFILGRIESDTEGIGASARALLALEARGKWDGELAQKVARTFLTHTHPLQQFRLQTERYPVIQLIDVMLAKYREPLKTLHEQDPMFLPNFITYFEGEKDPRNLMIVFSLLQVPMTEWDISVHAQDLFEAVFNYFPITFKPPPDDPYGITAQDLKNRLRDCIAANSDFAPHAFPSLLDKLDSSSMNTKRDSIQAIQACIAGYEGNTINLYSVTLWDALKFEILNVQEDDLAEEALKALGLIGGKFAKAEGPLNAYLRPIIKECIQHLEDAPTKQSAAAGQILYTVAKAGPAILDKIAKGIIPTLFTLYQGSSSITKRRGLLEVYNQILKASQDFEGFLVSDEPPALQASANDALEAAILAITNAPKAEVSFRLTALSTITQLASIQKALTDTDVNRAVDTVTNVILHEHIDGHGDISSEAIQGLVKMAGVVPETIRSKSIPAFMVELPDVPSGESSYVPVLEAFAQLSAEPQIFDTVGLRIKNKFNAARYQNAPRDYQRSLLLALLYVFTFGSPGLEDGIVRSSYFTEYVDPLIEYLREALPSERDLATTEIIGRILNLILRPQSLHFQSTVYNKNLSWMSNVSEVGDPVDNRIQHLAPFSLYFYASLRQEVVEPADVISLLRTQARATLRSTTPTGESVILSRHISLLVNKFLTPAEMQKTLTAADLDVKALLGSKLDASPASLVFAVVKALLIQGKSGALTSEYLQLLLNSLSENDKAFARRFSGLLSQDDIFIKANHCIISGLYKQRAFNQLVPALTEKLRSADQAVKPNYLIALSGLLRWLPYSVFEPSLASLVSPLLQSLDMNERQDQEVKSSTLTIFESLLMHDPTIAEEHSASLITRLLNSTTAPQNLPKVRAKALQCLTLVPRQLKPESVMPYRRPVVKKLLGCLDDAKRNVRAEAVRCRSAWLALDEGKDDEE